jgi:hypothetical protein
MRNSLEYQYQLLERMLGLKGEVIELYCVEDLPRMGLSKLQEKIVRFIIEKNKEGIAPTFKELNEACHFSSYRVLSPLRDRELIITPNIIQLASLLGKKGRGSRIDFSSLPKNVSAILHGYGGYPNSWRKRFENPSRGRRWPICSFACFYDRNGPVYQYCLGVELKYKPRRIFYDVQVWNELVFHSSKEIVNTFR